jgi:hypothetical protein
LRASRGITSVLLAASACTIAPAPDGAPPPSGVDELPPPGYGTLRQEQVSITLVSSGLQIMVTPLDESVTRVTAPDTYERLSSIAESHGFRAPADAELFLVSFYSDQPEARFVPEDVQLVSRGFRVRPEEIIPITPGWGQRRVGQRQTEMAVYAFPGQVPMETDMLLVYGLDQSAQWSAVLPRIQAERARARARAGVGG